MYRNVVAWSVAAGIVLAGMPALAATSPWVGRLEAEQFAGWNSNVEMRPPSAAELTQGKGAPGDLLFRTKFGGNGRYVFPTRTMITGQANYNLIRFAQLGQYNASMFLGNVMVMQPVFDFATVYGGAMGIVTHGDTTTGVWRFDKDVIGGLLLQTPVSKTSAVFGGYNLDWMLTDVATSAFRGHTLQAGYRQVVTDAFSLTGGYRFFYKDADVLEKQGRHTIGVTGRYGLWQNFLALTGKTEFTFINGFGLNGAPGNNSTLWDLSLMLNGGF
jgi:hypothetical protein